ncbi:MAG TPA: hypothetical protein VNH63_01755 [Gemmatimonadales bacterium]|nr:hypothetical protein [Gemmatimonadales bacterium]
MRARLAADFERFAGGLPRDFPAHVREVYGVDLTAEYLGAALPHPIGKGSGQLSLNAQQLEADAAAGLAFVVLKTVIAQDEAGAQSMAAWAIHESKMTVEQRRGWTVTWKGRGWDRSFEDYLALVRAGRDLTRAGRLLAVPSVKYHLPRLDEPFRAAEYRFTTAQLARAWGEGPLLAEKDFSPTLAGDQLARERDQILRWLREVPAQIRAAAPGPVRLAMKLMNARFDDDFQLDMVRASSGADALVVFNRLFDAERGVAYGGWDLSERNLRVLDRLTARPPERPLCGTGNICSGKMIVEYAKRGCSAVQLHTFFQLPLSEYAATAGSRTERALHQLVFHPDDGLVAALLDAETAGQLHRRDGTLHFLELADAHHHG